MHNALSNLSAAELVGKGIAPVKREYWKPPASRQEVAAVGSSEAAATAAPPERKSKRQAKRERETGVNLCINFLAGNCEFDKDCRFSHDIQAYLAQKPRELPGQCPFSAAVRCPYGITCLFASTHSNPDQNTAKYVQAQQSATASDEPDQTPTEVQLLATAEADAAVHAEVPSGPSVELVQKMPNASAGPAANDPGRSVDVKLPGVPARVKLPVATTIHDTVNTMSRDLQSQLRKQNYNFERADKVLADLGVRISRKNQPKKGKYNNTPPKGGTQTTHTSAQQPKPPAGNFSSDRGVSHLNGNASSRRQPADGESVKLFDVNRGKRDNGEASAMHVDVPLKPEEKKTIDFRSKLYLAPLTTVGNLPFRRICKGLGADITCGEMALATNLLQGQGSEWALLKRHPCEDMFGVQVCGGYADALSRTAQLIEENCDVDFVDVNMGCPIDLICSKGAGSSLLQKPRAIGQIVQGMSAVLSCPLTIKVRKGFNDNQDVTHTFLPEVRSWGACAVTLHGRSRQQRYSRAADWEYVTNCARQVPELPLIGNGDVFSWTDYQAHINADSPVATAMIARGALMKPWIFQEIKEQRHIDISASERLDLLKQFCSHGLEHWGSDAKGVETTRRFLLEWLSFLYRYVPVGLLEVVPQCMQWRPPAFFGRSDLETLLASDNAADWVRISEMLLGPTPANFSFAPKHKSNAYARSETEMAQAHEAEQENG
ncbi:hypothetical protein WJX79_009566 [Trebouxia sp. C0005]